MRLDDENPTEEEWLLTVDNIFHTITHFFLVNQEDTIYQLKMELQPLYGAAIQEMLLFIHPSDYPYPLPEIMPLNELKEEHRHLVVLIREVPELVVPSRIIRRDNIDCVTGRYVDHPRKVNVFDLRYIYQSDIPYLVKWIIHAPNIYRIDLNLSHEHLREILVLIAPYMYSCGINTLWFRKQSGEDISQEQSDVILREIRAIIIHMQRNPVHIQIVIDPGVFGNETDRPIEMTSQHMDHVDLIVASYLRQLQQ